MSQKKILIVDDENEILSVLERYISREKGYSVKSFNNPINALSAMGKDVNLVLLDVMMPQMNGLDLLPKLIDKNPNVKVLIMTAYSTLDKVLSAHRHGASDYIMKPFSSLDALGKKIDEMLKA